MQELKATRLETDIKIDTKLVLNNLTFHHNFLIGALPKQPLSYTKGE